jgi:ribosomal protein S18 acetylase RimI-like enzyme
MAGLFRTAEHLRACYISLQTRERNRAAHRFYERHGFTRHEDVVYEREIDLHPDHS